MVTIDEPLTPKMPSPASSRAGRSYSASGSSRTRVDFHNGTVLIHHGADDKDLQAAARKTHIELPSRTRSS